MSELVQALNERLSEIDEYLGLLEAVAEETVKGLPRIGDHPISAMQQKILYSTLYMQLYNLVESTVNGCLQAVAVAVTDGLRWKPSDLSIAMRQEWIRWVAKTHDNKLTDKKRLEAAVRLYEHLKDPHPPISRLSIERGGGGNWDEVAIAKLARRIDCELSISEAVWAGIKRFVRDDKGALELIKAIRNKLAHGEISFSQCGEGVTVSDLKDLKARTEAYLREVVVAFGRFVDDYLFIQEDRRPA